MSMKRIDGARYVGEGEHAGYTIDRVHKPSAIRRGRLAVDPVFLVITPDGGREVFLCRRDAMAWIATRIEEAMAARELGAPLAGEG